MAITSSPNSVLQGLTLASTDQLVLQGAASLPLSDQGSAAALDTAKGLYVLGLPRVLPSCVVPQGYVADLLARMTVGSATRVTMKATGQIVLGDDFGTRSRISLVGAN